MFDPDEVAPIDPNDVCPDTLIDPRSPGSEEENTMLEDDTPNRCPFRHRLPFNCRCKGIASGGGLSLVSANRTDFQVQIDESDIKRNNITAPHAQGGGLYVAAVSGNVVISNGMVMNNTAIGGNGGGAYVKTVSGSLTASNTMFPDNSAKNGGALYA